MVTLPTLVASAVLLFLGLGKADSETAVATTLGGAFLRGIRRGS